MGDPREDLTLLELENQGIPRIRVTPQPPPQPEQVYNPPPGHVGEWPRGTTYREVPPEPSLPPMQGRAPLEPDLSPGPSVWQPPRTPLQDAQAIGGLVRQGFNRFLAGPPAENRQRFEGPYTAPQAVGQGAGAVIGALVDPARMAVESQRTRSDSNADPLTQEQARQAGPGAAAEVSMNLAGINAPFAATRPGLGMFGSAMSPGADLMKLARAETMEKAGASAEKIRKETGWMRGADKQWMYEFSDVGARYKGDVNSIARSMFDRTWPSLKGRYGQRGYQEQTGIAFAAAQSKISGLTPTYLEDVLHHPELFRHEPKARKVPVENDPSMWGSGAYYELNPKEPKGRIKYREEDAPDKLARGRTLENILHETSHFLDNLYGMPRGTSPQAGNVGHAGTQANVIYQRLRAQNPIPPKLTYDEFKAKFGKGDTDARFAEYERSYTAQYSKQDQQLRQKAADEDYLRNAGENKAEAVTARMHLTPEQLAEISPEKWHMKVPFARQTVEYNRFRPRGSMPTPILEYPTTQMSVRDKPGGVLGTGVQPAKFPQYAERYPEVGPPVTAFDPVKKKEYLAKELTPEAEEFRKERARIMKDMEKKGFTPYFDPAKREHVDPSFYPPNVDTTKIVPKKQATIDEDMKTIGSEDARARLRKAYQRGSEMPNTKDWYAMKQLEDEFIKELGPEAGRKAFQERIATSMAATTGGADPTANWLMAAYGNYLRTNKLPYPAAAYEMPFPIGGRYASGNMAMHQKIFDEGGFAALGAANPKRHNFSQNFTGNRAAATMDEQMTSGMTPGINMPPPGKYGLYEQVLGEEARKVGVQPQNYQDVGWSGFKNLKDPNYKSGVPFIQTINESIERTHRLTGMPKEEIVRRGVIKGEIPMYVAAGLLGTSAIGSVVDPSGYNR